MKKIEKIRTQNASKKNETERQRDKETEGREGKRARERETAVMVELLAWRFHRNPLAS